MLGLLQCIWGFRMPVGLLNMFFGLYFLNDVASMPARKY